MKVDFKSRVALFGVAVFAYGLVMLVSSAINYSNHGHSTNDLCLAIGGAIMTAGGLYVIFKQDQDKMDAIGMYAVTFGIFKMFRAYGSGGDFWIIPFFLAIPFIVMGIRYFMGTSVSVISNIVWSVIYIFVDIFTLNLINLIDIFILVFFISILVSRDTLINTPLAKKIIGKSVELDSRVDAEVKYAKSYVDAFKDGIDNGLDAAIDDIQQSTEQRNEDVARSKEEGEEAKKKKYVLNRDTNIFEEKK